MNRFLPTRLELLVLVATCGAANAQTPPAPPILAASAPTGPTVRPEVGAPLQAVQELIKAKDGKAALAKLAEAESVPTLTPYEAYIIARLKAVAAIEAADPKLALTNFEKALASELLPAAERLSLIDVSARLAVQTKDYPRAVNWLTRYKDAGGTDEQLRRLLPQVLAEADDHAGSVREALALVQADDAARRPSTEVLLRNLAFSQNKLGDAAGYVAAMERLAQQHPKKDYWADLISRTERGPGFDGNRLRLDVYRLRRAIGITLNADELAEMAQRAQQAGLPAEAQALLDDGFAAGLLGKGKDAGEQQKLREQATKAALQDRNLTGEIERAALTSKDGNAAVNLGFALSGAGLHGKAVPLIELGLTKGGLRRPDEALLHHGVALWRAGRNDDAARIFAAVKGGDGSAGLARVWRLYLTSASKP